MRSLITFFCVGLLAACGGAPPATPTVVDAASIPGLPDWTDKYAATNTGDHRFFNISRLMAQGLSRLEAVEVQNHYRDLARAEPDGEAVARWNAALAKVKAGELESGVKAERLAAAKFIVVFDLDDTLYDQYRASGPGCHDVSYPEANGKTRTIKMVPGWEAILKRIDALGGVSVLFSANRDDPTLENLRHIKLDGQSLLEHPLIGGVLTNSFLVRQEKTEGPGAKKPSKGRPVMEASKDLRLFDEALEKVIIVDDNPTRLFQLRNARVFKKFHANKWCVAAHKEQRAAYDAAMGVVQGEIEESVAWLADHADAHFAGAYLPYTMLGRLAVDWLRETRGWDRARATEFLRTHPKLADTRF
jgi:hypothetical protein